MSRFLLGVATGVGLSIFFRSRKGKEMINNLKSSASNLVEDAIDKGTQKAKDFANELVSGKKPTTEETVITIHSGKM